ncbi:DUF6221 family protein [Streptomyces pseudovenezuelae]|uniref:DUF6221 family protein n=1 Tax=Streptomyces pseudovenezuelae TaxID=67350 RepID=UPI002E8085F4|nr:DUF6221 family protein [Streptomyces pseudovenezuelae]WUA94420.1 DUF6221 family protein [Streptomyces pseudovenezuelae]
MDDLVQFLRDRLDDDETIAREASHLEHGHWTTEDGYPVSVADELVKGADVFERVVAFDEGSPSEEQAAHIARHDPARVLVEVAAKKKILELYEAATSEAVLIAVGIDSQDGAISALTGVLQYLATAYADHPAYNEAWRP